MQITELKEVAKATGQSVKRVQSYIDLDWEYEEQEPAVDELIDHINYQQHLVRIFENCETEHDYAEAWCANN